MAHFSVGFGKLSLQKQMIEDWLIHQPQPRTVHWTARHLWAQLPFQDYLAVQARLYWLFMAVQYLPNQFVSQFFSRFLIFDKIIIFPSESTESYRLSTHPAIMHFFPLFLHLCALMTSQMTSQVELLILSPAYPNLVALLFCRQAKKGAKRK